MFLEIKIESVRETERGNVCGGKSRLHYKVRARLYSGVRTRSGKVFVL